MSQSKQKSILLINHYAGSREMGMCFRPFYMAEKWVEHGYKVTIIGGDFSHLRRVNPDVSDDLQEEIINGITYVWLKTGEYSTNGVARAMSMFRFCHKLEKYAHVIVEKYRPDVVIADSYPLDTYPAGKIARIANAKYIHEVRDMWPATFYETGAMSKHHPFVILMQIAENHAYKTADDVVSVLPFSENYMKEHGLRDGHFHYIPNGIVVEDWDENKEIPEIHRKEFEKLHSQNKFILGFFGSHEMSYGLFNIIDVVHELNDENVHLVLVGSGKLKQELIDYAKNNSVNNVTFLPPVPKDVVPAVVKNFDAIYIGTIDNPLYRFGISMNKMYDSMMAAKPIVMAVTTPSTPVKESGCGICTESCDNDAIKDAILRIKKMTPEERDEMGQKGRRAVIEKYSYDYLSSEFESLFD